MASGGAQHEAHDGHHARELGQTHQVPGSSPGGSIGDPVPGPFEHHHQRHPFLERQLAKAIALVRSATADRPAEHGHVFGSGQGRPAADSPGPRHERVAGDGGILRRPDQLADLGERAGIEEGGDPLTGIEASPFLLADEAGLATHEECFGLPTLDLLEGRAPALELVTHRAAASGNSVPCVLIMVQARCGRRIRCRSR